MKALEFRSEVTAGKTLTLPDEIAAQLEPAQPVRVLLLVSENDEHRSWEELTASQFGAGYADGDAIYDNLASR